MNTTLLTIYFLVWPALTLATLIVLCVGVGRDVRDSRRDGTPLV